MVVYMSLESVDKFVWEPTSGHGRLEGLRLIPRALSLENLFWTLPPWEVSLEFFSLLVLVRACWTLAFARVRRKYCTDIWKPLWLNSLGNERAHTLVFKHPIEDLAWDLCLVNARSALSFLQAVVWSLSRLGYRV